MGAFVSQPWALVLSAPDDDFEQQLFGYVVQQHRSQSLEHAAMPRLGSGRRWTKGQQGGGAEGIVEHERPYSKRAVEAAGGKVYRISNMGISRREGEISYQMRCR